MKLITRISVGIGTVVALTLGAAVVSAQPQGYGPGFGMGPGAGMMHGPGPMGRVMAGYGLGPTANDNPAAMAEARIAYLKAELKITPAQESAWKPFAEQGRQRAQAMSALRTTLHSAAQRTAPESFDLRSQMMKTRQEQMEKATKAFKDLYAVLAPEQKAIADQRFARMGGQGRPAAAPAH